MPEKNETAAEGTVPTTSAKILAIIVTYYPDRQALLALVKALIPQVSEIAVVDNTPAANDIAWGVLAEYVARHPQIRVIRFGANLGIATAINTGIRIALQEDFSHVLLSDQDSLPTAGMVSGLLAAEAVNSSPTKKVGAVGPVYQDRLTGLRYPFQVQRRNRLFYSLHHTSRLLPDVECLTLITSGTLISTDVLRDVGEMREDLFIDHVDNEWSHRARSMGYTLIGTGRSLLIHNMGDKCLRAWWFGWRKLNGYGPLRLYYRFRNFVVLLGLPYIPLRWKIRSSMYFVFSLYAHALFSSNRWQSMHAAISGITDGIRHRTGPHR